MALFWVLSLGITRAADLADASVAPPRGAVFPAIKDDLQVQGIPARFCKGAFQVTLGLDNAATATEAPALSEPMNMGIDRKSRHAECLCHDDTGGFMPDTG